MTKPSSSTAFNAVRVGQCVEAVCNCGCSAVRAIIENLESGLQVPETAGLSSTEQSVVLDELKAIMAVYDR